MVLAWSVLFVEQKWPTHAWASSMTTANYLPTCQCQEGILADQLPCSMHQGWSWLLQTHECYTATVGNAGSGLKSRSRLQYVQVFRVIPAVLRLNFD